MKFEKLTRHFPLLGLARATFFERSMLQLSAALAFHRVDDLRDRGWRETLVHFRDEIFLDRVAVEMKHRHERSRRSSILRSLEKLRNVWFIIAGYHRSNADPDRDTGIGDRLHRAESRLGNRRVRLEWIRFFFCQE